MTAIPQCAAQWTTGLQNPYQNLWRRRNQNPKNQSPVSLKVFHHTSIKFEPLQDLQKRILFFYF